MKEKLTTDLDNNLNKVHFPIFLCKFNNNGVLVEKNVFMRMNVDANPFTLFPSTVARKYDLRYFRAFYMVPKRNSLFALIK